jgi:hypothetical protein
MAMALTKREQRRIDLIDFALANPDGITVEDMMAEFGWNMRVANETIRDVRLYLGEFEDINFPCDPDPADPTGRWLYRLVGTLDEVRGWTANRMGDAESRLRTMQAMMKSIVAATNGRTTIGRKARTTEKALRRLVEDLDDIVLDGTP